MISLHFKKKRHWEQFWANVAALGELSKREAGLLADAGRRGLALNWENERSPDGGRWHPLAKFTQEQRRSLGFAAKRPILKRTGDLRDSFTSAGNPRNISDVGHLPGGVVVVIGAKENPSTPGRIQLLNYGGYTSAGHIVPARRFIGFSKQALDWIGSQANNIVDQRVERLGR